MVGTITPLVQEAREKHKKFAPALIVVLFVLSSLLGAVVLVAVARLVRLLGAMAAGGPVEVAGRNASLIIASVAAYVLVARALGRGWLPMFDRQVPLSWRQSGQPGRAAMLYSFVLGAAIVTRINSPAV